LAEKRFPTPGLEVLNEQKLLPVWEQMRSGGEKYTRDIVSDI
jgi:hypothetical protein